jgi:hypothetical protein
MVAVVEEFDDAGLTGLFRDAAALRAEADALVTAVAGVVAKRSDRALGYAGLAQRDGHRTPVAMVQSITGGSRAEAARQVRFGEALGEADAAARLSGTADAHDCTEDTHDGTAGTHDSTEDAPVASTIEEPWYAPITVAVTAGRITAEAGAAIMRGLGQPCERVGGDALRAAADEMLAESAGLNADELMKRARWARDGIDPTGVDERTQARFDARTWRFGRDRTTGAHTAWVVFDDESAAWVHAIIGSALAPRRGGPRFVDPDVQTRAETLLADPRSNDQLIFDTIMDVLHAGALADAGIVFGTRQPGVRLVITKDNADTRDRDGNITGTGYYESTGEAVAGPVVDRHICNSGVVPITVDTDGAPLDVGREQRLFTARQRIAMRIRDGGCLFPGCDRPPEYGEAHHINQWVADHGRTDIADGVLLCRHHHMLLHNNTWRIAREKTAYTLIPPATVDPARVPIPLRSKSPLRPTGARTPTPGERAASGAG